MTIKTQEEFHFSMYDLQIEKNRNYDDYSMNDCINIILQDIQKYGQSIGWQGENDYFHALSKKLKHFDIVYSNNSMGSWQKKNKIDLLLL